jgi:hypothetical protein
MNAGKNFGGSRKIQTAFDQCFLTLGWVKLKLHLKLYTQ